MRSEFLRELKFDFHSGRVKIIPDCECCEFIETTSEKKFSRGFVFKRLSNKMSNKVMPIPAWICIVLRSTFWHFFLPFQQAVVHASLGPPPSDGPESTGFDAGMTMTPSASSDGPSDMTAESSSANTTGMTSLLVPRPPTVLKPSSSASCGFSDLMTAGAEAFLDSQFRQRQFSRRNFINSAARFSGGTSKESTAVSILMSGKNAGKKAGQRNLLRLAGIDENSASSGVPGFKIQNDSDAIPAGQKLTLRELMMEDVQVGADASNCTVDTGNSRTADTGNSRTADTVDTGNSRTVDAGYREVDMGTSSEIDSSKIEGSEVEVSENSVALENSDDASVSDSVAASSCEPASSRPASITMSSKPSITMQGLPEHDKTVSSLSSAFQNLSVKCKNFVKSNFVKSRLVEAPKSTDNAPKDRTPKDLKDPVAELRKQILSQVDPISGLPLSQSHYVLKNETVPFSFRNPHSLTDPGSNFGFRHGFDATYNGEFDSLRYLVDEMLAQKTDALEQKTSGIHNGPKNSYPNSKTFPYQLLNWEKIVEVKIDYKLKLKHSDKLKLKHSDGEDSKNEDSDEELQIEKQTAREIKKYYPGGLLTVNPGYRDIREEAAKIVKDKAIADRKTIEEVLDSSISLKQISQRIEEKVSETNLVLEKLLKVTEKEEEDASLFTNPNSFTDPNSFAVTFTSDEAMASDEAISTSYEQIRKIEKSLHENESRANERITYGKPFTDEELCKDILLCCLKTSEKIKLLRKRLSKLRCELTKLVEQFHDLSYRVKDDSLTLKDASSAPLIPKFSIHISGLKNITPIDIAYAFHTTSYELYRLGPNVSGDIADSERWEKTSKVRRDAGAFCAKRDGNKIISVTAQNQITEIEYGRRDLHIPMGMRPSVAEVLRMDRQFFGDENLSMIEMRTDNTQEQQIKQQRRNQMENQMDMEQIAQRRAGSVLEYAILFEGSKEEVDGWISHQILSASNRKRKSGEDSSDELTDSELTNFFDKILRNNEEAIANIRFGLEGAMQKCLREIVEVERAELEAEFSESFESSFPKQKDQQKDQLKIEKSENLSKMPKLGQSWSLRYGSEHVNPPTKEKPYHYWEIDGNELKRTTAFFTEKQLAHFPQESAWNRRHLRTNSNRPCDRFYGMLWSLDEIDRSLTYEKHSDDDDDDNGKHSENGRRFWLDKSMSPDLSVLRKVMLFAKGVRGGNVGEFGVSVEEDDPSFSGDPSSSVEEDEILPPLMAILMRDASLNLQNGNAVDANVIPIIDGTATIDAVTVVKNVVQERLKQGIMKIMRKSVANQISEGAFLKEVIESEKINSGANMRQMRKSNFAADKSTLNESNSHDGAPHDGAQTVAEVSEIGQHSPMEIDATRQIDEPEKSVEKHVSTRARETRTESSVDMLLKASTFGEQVIEPERSESKSYQLATSSAQRLPTSSVVRKNESTKHAQSSVADIAKSSSSFAENIPVSAFIKTESDSASESDSDFAESDSVSVEDFFSLSQKDKKPFPSSSLETPLPRERISRIQDRGSRIQDYAIQDRGRIQDYAIHIQGYRDNKMSKTFRSHGGTTSLRTLSPFSTIVQREKLEEERE